MRARTTTAALILALVAPVWGAATAEAAAPGAIDVVPHLAPNDGHPTAPYVDLEHQVIHDGARTVTITPALTKPLQEVWATANGYLARDSAESVYLVTPEGASSLLVLDVGSDDSPVAVENGGQRVAVSVLEQSTDPTTVNPTYVDIYRTSDGARLNRLPVKSPGGTVFGFRNGIVTLNEPARGTFAGHPAILQQLATWDVSGQAVTMGGKRLNNPQFVDVDAGVMGRAAHLGYGPVTVLPIVKGSRKSWTVPDDYVASFSPDGRLAVTFYVPRKGDRSPIMTLRNARTGAAKRTFLVDARVFSGWETNRSVLMSVFDPAKKKSALMRLSLNGKVERVSGYAKHPDRLLTVT